MYITVYRIVYTNIQICNNTGTGDGWTREVLEGWPSMKTSMITNIKSIVFCIQVAGRCWLEKLVYY